MTHLALVVPGLDKLGGAERQVLSLAHGFRRRGWRVSVIALTGNGGAAASELFAGGITFLSLAMRKGWADPRGWLRFRSWLGRERPDIVHSHLPHATWLARWSRLAARVPLIIDTLHTSTTGGFCRRLGYRVSGWLSDCVTAVSQAAAEAHLKARMVSARKLRVLPNGVDVNALRPNLEARAAARSRLGLTTEFVWFAAGRLDPVKDYATLVQAMTGVPPPSRLFIAGQGPLEAQLKQLRARLGLENRVRFVGFQPDLRPFLDAADAFVLSSLWEGLPMALLEAAACGLPAVATDVPGTREVLIQGATGWLVPPSDPAALARSMAELMQLPPEERHAMGDRARQRVLDCFSLESVLDRWEQLYSQLGAKELTAPYGSGAFAPATAKAPGARTSLR